MSQTLTIATWNIAEGYLARSSDLFDYEDEENLDYFIDELKKISPDVVCISETNIPKDNARSADSLTARISKAMGLTNIHEASMHQSRHGDKSMLGLGLIALSKFTVRDVALEQPAFPLLFANGEKSIPHTRWLFVADFSSFVLGVVHNWPMRIFQHSYETAPGASYGKYLDDTYSQTLPSNHPLILAGDLNFDSPEKVIPQTINKFKLREALPLDQPTDIKGSRPDHILYNPNFECLASKVIPGSGDHNLCYAKLRLK